MADLDDLISASGTIVSLSNPDVMLMDVNMEKPVRTLQSPTALCFPDMVE